MRYYINMNRYREALGLRSQVGLRGRFTVQLEHARTGLIKRRLEFDNLIVDSGLDYLIGDDSGSSSYADAIARCAVSTDNTPPDEKDTSLPGQVASTTRTHSVGSGRTSAPSYTVWREREYLFELNEANGNLAKVAIQFTNGTLWAVQLFRDEQGNPTVISKTAEDKLRITYRLEAQPLLDTQHYTISVPSSRNPSGVQTDVSTRPVALTHNASWLDGNLSLGRWTYSVNPNSVLGGGSAHDRQNFLALTSTAGTTNARHADISDYVAGSFMRETEVVWEASAINFAGGVSWLGNSGQTSGFQHLLDPGIDKTDEDELIVGFRFNFARLNDA